MTFPRHFCQRDRYTTRLRWKKKEGPVETSLPAIPRKKLVAAKAYVVDLIEKGNIRRRKSHYGASLFLAKEKDNLRTVVDYRA